MNSTEDRSLTNTMLGVAGVLLIIATVLIVTLAASPSGGLTVPKADRVARVSLSDYSIQGPSTLAPGKYEFVVTNKGTVPHELVMFATTAAATGMPMGKDGDVNEDSSSLESVVDSGSSLAPGESRILYGEFEAGHYVMVCNLAGHYRLGMREDVAVH
jgi:uncharacterized cupredoxin-like copper-binding protein